MYVVACKDQLALTSNEFDVQIRRCAGEWSRESINMVFATALTLLIVPVLYLLFFRVSFAAKS